MKPNRLARGAQALTAAFQADYGGAAKASYNKVIFGEWNEDREEYRGIGGL
jgi:hypothetical protein